jgi:hypothetical protein
LQPHRINPRQPNAQELSNTSNVNANLATAGASRVFAALVAGLVAGAGDVTGVKGFAVFVGFQLANALVMYATCFGSPRRFYKSPLPTFLAGLTSQTELLTFVLLWTFTHNIIYLF